MLRTPAGPVEPSAAQQQNQSPAQPQQPSSLTRNQGNTNLNASKEVDDNPIMGPGGGSAFAKPPGLNNNKPSQAQGVSRWGKPQIQPAAATKPPGMGGNVGGNKPQGLNLPSDSDENPIMGPGGASTFKQPQMQQPKPVQQQQPPPTQISKPPV